jgi:hypothetical protein
MADAQQRNSSKVSGKVETWIAIATFLGGIVVSGVAFFLVEGRDHLTAEDMERNSPYTRDKGTIAKQFDEVNRRLDRIEDQLDRLLERKDQPK